MATVKRIALYISNQIKRTKDEVFLLNSSFALFLILYIFPLSNKQIMILFLLYLIFISLKIRNFGMGLIITYFFSSIFAGGKSYIFQLRDLSAYHFLHTVYPLGLITTFTISYSDIIASILFILFVRNIILKKNSIRRYFCLFDFLLLLCSIWYVINDLLFSTRPFLSMILHSFFFEDAIIYYYIRFFIPNHAKLFRLLLALISITIIVESFMAFTQYISSSPLGKSFESVQSIIPYGGAPDEQSFVFRPTGTLSYANSLALFIIILLPFIFVAITKIKKKLNKSTNNKAFYLSFFFGIATLILTLSRGSWLVFCIGLLYLLYIAEYKMKFNFFKTNLRKIILVTAAISILLSPIIAPRIMNSIYSVNQTGGIGVRIQEISESLQLFLSNPTHGTGNGLSVGKAIDYNPIGIFSKFPSSVHNYYILLAVENGWPALLIFILLILLSIKSLGSSKGIYNVARIVSIFSMLLIALIQPFFNWGWFLFLMALNFDKIQ